MKLGRWGFEKMESIIRNIVSIKINHNKNYNFENKKINHGGMKNVFNKKNICKKRKYGK